MIYICTEKRLALSMSDAPLEGLAPVWSLGTGVAEALLQAREEMLLAQSCFLMQERCACPACSACQERPTVTFLPSAAEARQVQIGRWEERWNHGLGLIPWSS